jgi:Zn-dependent protease with chaperone function
MPVWGSQWVAAALDRRTGEKRKARVSVKPEGLEVERADGSFEIWPYAELEQGFESAREVEFVRGEVALRIPDKGIVGTMRHLSPEARAKFRNPGAAKFWGAMAVVVGAIALGAFLVWKLVGWAGEWAAANAPRAMERKIGELAFPQVAPEGMTCGNAALNEALASMMERLDPEREYALRVVDSPEVNALTLPGGYIAVYRGLLRRAETAEEVAGVLAHEIQHARGRHSMKALGRQFAIWMFIGVVTGGLETTSAQMAGAAGALRYQREDEMAADEGALEMLREARIEAGGLERFFERLSREEERVPWLASQFATHPDVRDRLERVRAWRAANAYAARELMNAGEWRSLRALCR